MIASCSDAGNMVIILPCCAAGYVIIKLSCGMTGIDSFNAVEGLHPYDEFLCHHQDMHDYDLHLVLG